MIRGSPGLSLATTAQARSGSTSTCRASTRRCSLPFEAIFVPDAMREAVSDDAWLKAMLDAELALARAQARVGVIPAEAAHEVAEACRLERFDAEAIAREARSAGNPIPALVAAADEQWFHQGATSQDIVDTAAMLVASTALGLIDADLGGVA